MRPTDVQGILFENRQKNFDRSSQSEILTQVRDTIHGSCLDVSLPTNSLLFPINPLIAFSVLRARTPKKEAVIYHFILSSFVISQI